MVKRTAIHEYLYYRIQLWKQAINAPGEAKKILHQQISVSRSDCFVATRTAGLRGS